MSMGVVIAASQQDDSPTLSPRQDSSEKLADLQSASVRYQWFSLNGHDLILLQQTDSAPHTQNEEHIAGGGGPT